MKEYYVYLMCNRSGTLYCGMTSALEKRVMQHKTRAVPGFTAKYHIDRLVWFASTNDVHIAIEFEKRIKGWRRSKKIALIESTNPAWKDLSKDWYPKRKNT
jgi:putative endonuclease